MILPSLALVIAGLLLRGAPLVQGGEPGLGFVQLDARIIRITLHRVSHLLCAGSSTPCLYTVLGY